jgi:RND family efflux transporter MFP subunit
MKKPVLIIPALAVLLGAGFLLLRGGPAPSPSLAPSVAVQTVMLTETTVPRLVQAYGSVTGGLAERDIVTPAPGIVAHLLAAPGQAVSAGQVLARLAPGAQDQADHRKAQDAVTAAQAGYTHTAALLATHLATSADLAAAAQALHDAQAQLAALNAPRTVIAPANGIVTAVLAAQGSEQAAGTSLFRFVDSAHIAATVGVPEDQAAGIVPGAPATLTLLNTGGTVNATVAQRAAALDPQTGLVGLTLALASPAALGEPVSAQVQAGTLTGYIVPPAAVLNDEQGDYVFQQGPDGLAHRASVQVLGQSGSGVVLAPTLNTALPLITTGAYQLDDGAAVRPAAAN